MSKGGAKVVKSAPFSDGMNSISNPKMKPMMSPAKQEAKKERSSI